MLALLTVLACHDASDAAGGLTATPWHYAEDSAAWVGLSGEELASTLGEVVAALVRIDPHHVYDAWDEAGASLDEACPVRGDHNGQPLFEGDCTAANGTAFYGYELVNRIFGFWVDFPGVDGFQHEFSWMTGNSRVELADGRVVVFGGDALWSSRQDEAGYEARTLYLYGSFHWDRPSAAPGWMDEALEVELHLEASDLPDGTRSVAWNGGVTGLGGAVAAFRMEDLALRPARVGNVVGPACTTEPEGSLSLLGRDGHWYAVVFDEACDGCARVVGEGADARVCADWTAALGWEDSPWE